MKMKAILSLIATIFICSITSAQSVIWTDETSNLPTNIINCISVDKMNTKWFGTNGTGGGLVSYDTIWKTYSMPGANKWTNIIVNDLSGNAWIGGEYFGLIKFPSMAQYTTGNSGITSNYVTGLSLDTTGLLWIADSSMSNFNGITWNTNAPAGILPLANATQKNKNYIWTAGTGGVAYYNGSIWTSYNPGNSGLPSYNDYCLAIDRNNNIWVGSDSGVTKYNGSGWTTYNSNWHNAPFTATVMAIAVDKNNNIWVGTSGQGLFIYNGSSWTSYNTGIYFSGTIINAIAFDSTGQVWVGMNSFLLKGYVKGYTRGCPPPIAVAPSICYCSVDTSSKFNAVYWDKAGLDTSLIDSIKIYRKVSLNYVKIGEVSIHSYTTCSDTGINPNNTSALYEMSVVDTCHDESPLGSFHKTILLQASIGVGNSVNLSWNTYVGDSVLYYRILRDDFGNGNWHKLDSVPSALNAYTDLTPPASTSVRYVINTLWSLTCSPKVTAALNSNSSRIMNNYTFTSYSNTKKMNISGINEMIKPSSIEVFPNPVSNLLTLNFKQPIDGNIIIVNMLGQNIYNQKITMNALTRQIDLGNLPGGIYTLKLITANGQTIIKKIIKL